MKGMKGTILGLGALAAAAISTVLHHGKTTVTYEPLTGAITNPLTGFAAMADYPSLAETASMVFVKITWAELEPEEGVFDWAGIEERLHLSEWRAKGKHAVLRFVCDDPGDEAHLDIPAWLAEKTGWDGVQYDISYGKGYAPNYNNPVFLEAHEKAAAALGERYGGNGFISFVQMGSLGHWGEWHVKSDEGLPPMPLSDTRKEYIRHFAGAFPDARLLLRRPFLEGLEWTAGVYNDMAGDPDATEEWLNWLENGGVYSQTGEHCLTAIDSFWQKAPVGGEFTSGIPMDELLDERLEETLSLLARSHATFLGPKIPTEKSSGADAVLASLGYRLEISKMSMGRAPGGKTRVVLTWKNSGNAPFYWDWPVYLYEMDADGTVIRKTPVNLSLSALMDGETVMTETLLSERPAVLGVGIEDPMTGEPAVRIASEMEQIGKISVLYRK